LKGIGPVICYYQQHCWMTNDRVNSDLELITFYLSDVHRTHHLRKDGYKQMNKTPLTWKQARNLALAAFALFCMFWVAYGKQISAAFAASMSSSTIHLSDSVNFPMPPGWPGWDQTPVRNSDGSAVQKERYSSNMHEVYRQYRAEYQLAGGDTTTSTFLQMEDDILAAINNCHLEVAEFRAATTAQMQANGSALNVSAEQILNASFKAVPQTAYDWLVTLSHAVGG
jgi:hypothetical protein